MKGKVFRKFRKIVACLALTICARLALVRSPSDQQMRNNFQTRAAKFEQIRTMMANDRSVATVAQGWTQTSQGEMQSNQLSPDRVALYRSIMKELGVVRVDQHNGRVQLAVWGGGLGDTTWSIGYVWSDKALAPLVSSAISQRPARDKWHFSPLGRSWFLYQHR